MAKCKNCSKEFEPKVYNQKFCSKVCCVQHHNNQWPHTCLNCGEKFLGRENQPFCSKSCSSSHSMSGANNPRWNLHTDPKVRAKSQLEYAVRKGLIIKPDICELCHEGDYRIEGHHQDYSKPFEVNWLCTRCHKLVESAVREAKRIAC